MFYINKFLKNGKHHSVQQQGCGLTALSMTLQTKAWLVQDVIPVM